MADELTTQATGIELRTEQGELQGKLYGHYLEVVRRGIVTIYDTRTGRRVRTQVISVQRNSK
jgi:hypothetical protein